MHFYEINYDLQKAINSVAGKHHRLIVVTGGADICNCALIDFPLINLNLKLSDKLKDLPEQKRARSTPKLIANLVRDYNEEVLIFNNFEILFLPEIQVDIMRLFEELSKERTIVLLWPGTYENGVLYYAEPWHREYREYGNVDAVII